MPLICRNGTIAEPTLYGARVRLPNGAVILSTAQDNADYRATARRLGYGDDAIAMARDHDRFHAWLADKLGLPASYSMRAVAGQLPEADRELAALEEAAVMSLQEFCR
jgi:hypothetical protein